MLARRTGMLIESYLFLGCDSINLEAFERHSSALYIAANMISRVSQMDYRGYIKTVVLQ